MHTRAATCESLSAPADANEDAWRDEESNTHKLAHAQAHNAQFQAPHRHTQHTDAEEGRRNART
eukprot:202863-Pleurochrysis_carterae.AAC.3